MNRFFYIFIVFMLLSCASDKPEGKTAAEILYKEAQELIEAERFILALEKLNQIKTEHPYSFYATPAELLQADVLFLQENYIEAAASYLLFRDFHPKHEKIAYVVFRIAESYFKQIPGTIDRDLDPAIESIKYYEEVIQKYGESSFKSDAENRIKLAKKMLNEKDLYIADFYFKTKVFSAARYWYLDILDNHKSKKTRNHAMLRTILSSYQLKDWQGCLEFIEKFYQLVDKQFHIEIRSTRKKCELKS